MGQCVSQPLPPEASPSQIRYKFPKAGLSADALPDARLSGCVALEDWADLVAAMTRHQAACYRPRDSPRCYATDALWWAGALWWLVHVNVHEALLHRIVRKAKINQAGAVTVRCHRDGLLFVLATTAAQPAAAPPVVEPARPANKATPSAGGWKAVQPAARRDSHGAATQTTAPRKAIPKRIRGGVSIARRAVEAVHTRASQVKSK